MFTKSFVSLLAALAAFASTSLAQTPSPQPALASKLLTVVTRKVTPFVLEKNGHLTGYSIELWERIVRETRLPFDPDSGYKVVENVQQMLDELREGRADAGVAASALRPSARSRSTSVIPLKNPACRF